jgi:SAM-dependent methyltransferase
MKDWDACYRAGDTPWDKGAPAPPLLEVVERLGTAIWGSGPVLVPGCGLGHDVRALAASGIPVLGLDISETAVEMARSLPVAGGETYEAGDFLDPSWREGRHFSAVWEHTCFCAIHPSLRENYAAAAAGVLQPGGMLIGVFYLTPNDPGEVPAGPPFNVSVAELDGCFSPWFERIDAWVPQRVYPGREGREWLAVLRKLPHARVAG